MNDLAVLLCQWSQLQASPRMDSTAHPQSPQRKTQGEKHRNLATLCAGNSTFSGGV